MYWGITESCTICDAKYKTGDDNKIVEYYNIDLTLLYVWMLTLYMDVFLSKIILSSSDII